LHIYFKDKSGLIKSSVGKVGWKIDIRSVGGYVVAAGSVLSTGTYTAGVVEDVKDLPLWLERVIVGSQHLEVFPRGSSSVGIIPPASDKYTEAGILNECAALRLAREGSRNDSLNTAAFKCGQLVAQNPSYLKFAVDTLAGSARSIGLDETEYRRTIGSGISSGIQNPRGSR
jgi:hypothetical protein